MAPLLIVFRLRLLDRRTQGQPEAAAVGATRRGVCAAVRRPAKRCIEAPTAATARAVRAHFGNHRVHYVAFFIGNKPIMRPLRQVTMHVK